jgi:hypothetical protein
LGVTERTAIPMSNLVRTGIVRMVAAALREADEATHLKHAGLVGRVREIVLRKILEPVLPPEVKCGTGKLTDRHGNLSGEIDVVLYSKNILPPSLFDERNGVFPIESVLYTIEVKSRLSAAELQSTIKSAKQCRSLQMVNTQHWTGATDQATITGTPYPIHAIFALATDLAGSAKTEVERYAELDEGGRQSPAIQALCVRGAGYWLHDANSISSWSGMRATDDCDEIITFLGGLTNTLPRLIAAKGRPQFGMYLSSGHAFGAA